MTSCPSQTSFSFLVCILLFCLQFFYFSTSLSLMQAVNRRRICNFPLVFFLILGIIVGDIILLCIIIFL